MKNYLDQLNKEQLQAVTHKDGPLLIIAGAGSGKTKVLTTRIAHLIKEHGVEPENILAVTFTNKASAEMRQRVSTLIPNTDKLWLGTFHGIGLRILKQDGALLGIDQGFTIYDDQDQMTVAKNVIKDLNINDKSLSPRNLMNHISRAKNAFQDETTYDPGGAPFLTERITNAFSLYEKRLRDMNALDFGDLICKPILLFKNNPTKLAEYQNKFKYLLVDEYQDTNHSQYLLLKYFAPEKDSNICVVGDPDQSIYAWRGADISNILDFERDFDDTTVIRLEQNYRSTENILKGANAVIENNTDRFEKHLRTDKGDGEKIVFEVTENEYDEARRVIQEVKNISHGDKNKLKNMAIFYRTNAQSRIFEEHLIKESIPYTIIGGFKFYDRKEIKDSLALLRIIANPRDRVSFNRIINIPPRGIGKVTLDKIAQRADCDDITLISACDKMITEGQIKKASAREFVQAFRNFERDRDEEPLHELTLRLVEDVGYMSMLLNEGTDESQDRMENIDQLIKAIADFELAPEVDGFNTTEMLKAFLDQVALIADVDTLDDKQNRLPLMTIHSAKGLEFKHVFLTGMEEGLFPHSRSESIEEIEEERRLCYVAMTRAMDSLKIFRAKTRMIFGETRFQSTSRFIEEIDKTVLEKVNDDSYSASSQVYYDDDEDENAYNQEDYSASSNNYSQVQYKKSTITPPKANKQPAASMSTEVSYSDPWKPGARITHPNFGLGIIKTREGSGANLKLTINFKHAGLKKIMLRYANITPA